MYQLLSQGECGSWNELFDLMETLVGDSQSASAHVQ